ncbi:MAG: hypothetical protein IPK80_15580 [Nannocystis sp.]|nr:hypothetical protein [Nannocystis sp.]
MIVTSIVEASLSLSPPLALDDDIVPPPSVVAAAELLLLLVEPSVDVSVAASVDVSVAPPLHAGPADNTHPITTTPPITRPIIHLCSRQF